MLVTNPFSPGTWTRDQIDNVSRSWWVLLVTGIVGVVAGGIILFTDWSVSDLAAFIGAVLLFRGIFTMFSVPLDGSGRGWSVALGVIEALVGLTVWVWPGATLLVVAFFIGWYVLFSGIMTIAGSISARSVLPYWGLMLAFGILETLFSFWLLARPGLTLVAAVLALGLWSLIYGVIQIVLAFETKNLSARADNVDRKLNTGSGRSFGAAAGR
ncbi:MAG: hypothetical protein JWM72_429 [Actinomycetia bacterium]|jgi:uncharacterized membrane protein HdeD (DUF308 family)|nr:hypothetical protein [Actinomycetes bacterium]